MALGKKTPENLLSIMECRFVPAVYTGNAEKDNIANTELYLRLLDEGKTQGFCPVLVDKEIKHYMWEEKYGLPIAKKITPKSLNGLLILLKTVVLVSGWGD